MPRLIKILRRTKKGCLPKKYIEDRGDPEFINEWLKQQHAPRDSKAKSFQALLKGVLKTRKIPRQSYIEKTNDFDDLLAQLDDLVPPELPKKGKKGKKGKKSKKGTSRKGKKKGAPPPPEIEPFSDDDDDDDGVGDAAADIAMPPAAASAAAAAAADPLAPIADDDILADVLGTDAAAAVPSAVADAFLKGAQMATAKKKRKKAPAKVESHYALRSRNT